MKKVGIVDEWSFQNAGGCSNFGLYDRNPIFAINVTTDCDLQVRLSILSEVSSDGSSLITQSEGFQYCVNAAIYRVSTPRFPPTSGSIVVILSIDLKGLANPILTTNHGKFSNSLSAIVSERVRPFHLG